MVNEDVRSTKYLSEVIDYEKDIGPYKLIQIYAGVGSGKNYWVQTLAEQGMNVLFITSRKITAEVQDTNIKGIKVDLEKWHRHTLNGRPVGGDQYVVSRTNAWVDHFARNIFDPKDSKTHIWKYFDFIFLDEAHSVVTDATFADSSFQVWRFISWVVEQATKDKNIKCKVILMSGTPEPLELLIPKKTRDKEWYNYVDCFEQCNHVEPKEVIIRHEYEKETEKVAKVIKKYFKENKRVIYFTSSIEHILQLIKDLRKLEITETEIGVSFTSDEKIEKFTKYMQEKKKRTEDSLQTAELLPDDVRIFLTTTKNKEGINIQNDDIKIMFAESSQRSELKQMAGRVRKGLDELIVMYNLSRAYSDVIKKWERYFAKESLEHITDKFNAFTGENEKPSRKQVIASIEYNFPYARFDFFRQTFLLFKGKIEGEDLATRDRGKIDDWISHWDSEVMAKSGAILPQGKEAFQEWFPYSTVRLTDKEPTNEEIEKAIIENYLKEHNLIEKIISTEESDNIFEELNTILQSKISGYEPLTALGYLVRRADYKKEDYGAHDGTQCIIRPLTEEEKEKKKKKK